MCSSVFFYTKNRLKQDTAVYTHFLDDNKNKKE